MKRGTRKQWTERIERWSRSGQQTARDFAAQEGVRPSTLSWWKGELRRAARASPGFIEVAPQPTQSVDREGCVEVVLSERLRIRVWGSFDAAVLRRTVAALEGR